ncbi:hypothetical protein [Rothia mucilaginosa]|uniref:hypothetical protein n=1 Tax=Rothia mucilaginosa TaxID=43675 RepID=UPI00066A2941|nr:hypothetical protein [Rothia mucilaginosa]
MSEYHAPSRRALLAGGALAATAAGVSAFSPAHAEQANKTEEFMTRAPEWVKNTQKRLDEFNKRLQYLTYTDTAREYTAHNLAKNGLHVNALDYCVDPTGVEDCTDQLNKLAERLYWLGGGSIELPAGIYKVSHPFIDLLDKVEFFGHGMSTQIIATSTYKLDDAVRKNRDECFGVFHTGTYRERASLKVTNNRPMRFGVRDMWIRTSTKKGAINVDQLRDNMHAGEPLAHVAGVILHTEFTGKPNDPEAVPSLSNLEIWDVDMGVAILGLHDRGMKVDKIRVRKSLRQGLLVGKPVGHPLRRIDDNNPGGADNKFLTVDISDANLSGKNYAGIEIYASQCKFFGSTSWYNRRSVPKNSIYVTRKENQSDNQYTAKAGAGWYVAGTRNLFQGCTAQENGGHGWFALMPRNNYVGCIGESSSWHDAVSDKAHNHEAANWYISSWASDCTFTGVRSDNPYEDSDNPEDKFSLDTALAARWGFYIEGGAGRLNIIGANAFDACHQSSKQRTSDQIKLLTNNWILRVDKPLYKYARIEVNHYSYNLGIKEEETPEKKLSITV